MAQRHRDCLAGLVHFRRLHTKQLEQVMFGGSDVKPASREVMTWRILQHLRRRGLVAAARRATAGPGSGSAPFVYSVTECGCRYLERLDPTFRGARPAPCASSAVEHSLMIADIALVFSQSAATHPGHRISEWGDDGRAAELLGSRGVIPDGHFVYATTRWEVEAFVEADLGSERPIRFARKIAEYVGVLRHGSWRAQLAAWPVVLTVTPDNDRATMLRRVTEELLRRQPDSARLAEVTEFDFTSMTELVASPGPLGRIWQVAGRDGIHEFIP